MPWALTRRAFGQLVGASALGLALGCGDDQDGDVVTATLEPGPTSLVVAVWARTGGALVVLARAPGGPGASAALALAPGEPGHVVLAGLAPSTTYAIEVARAGAVVARLAARTAPADDDPRPVLLAVSGDLDPSPAFDSDLVEHVLAAEPELFVSLGDAPYTDNGPVAETVAEYRARHVELRGAPVGRRLYGGVGVRAIYDDHEFRNDWDAEWAAREPARYAAALQVWDEFFPIPGAPPDVRYRRWRWGAHVEAFLLDTRRHRGANAAEDDPTKSMLGAAQRAWLVEGVTRSAATFKLIFTSVPLDFGVGRDHWAGYTVERAAILDALVGVPGVLFVSADQHYYAAHRHAHGVREIQVGPFARGLGAFGPSAPGVLFRAARYNAGLLAIDGDAVVVRGLGAGGEVFHEERLTAAELTPRPT